MNFIKKIFFNAVDEAVRAQFVRFGTGRYEKKAIINFKKNGKIKLSTSFEFANDLVLFVSELASTFNVNGILLSKKNPENLLKELNIQAECKRKKILQAEINAALSTEQIKKISSFAYFMLFDCSAEGLWLRIKKKLPGMRPSKTGESKVDEKFCTLEADKKFLPMLKEDFLFDMQECKKARTEHIFVIEEIILPEEKDPELLRIKAKRKGKIIRKIIFDGKEQIREKEFVV